MQRLKKRITIETLVSAGALSFLFLAWGRAIIALGISIGVFTGIGCFRLLARDVSESASRNLQKIKAYFFLKYLTRYAIMGIILFLCAKFSLKLFLGASAGLLLIPIAVFKTTYKECKTQAK